MHFRVLCMSELVLAGPQGFAPRKLRRADVVHVRGLYLLHLSML